MDISQPSLLFAQVSVQVFPMMTTPNSAAQISTLVDLVQDHAKNQPDKIAYRFLSDGVNESDQLTYQALDQKARAIAAQFQSIAKPGDRALMLYAPGIEFVTAFLGCLYAQIIAVPIYPPAPIII